MYVISDKNGAASSGQNSRDFLADSPRGAYTTARTVGGDSIFELSFHIARLATSAKIMTEAAAQNTTIHQDIINPDTLKPRVVSSIRAAVDKYRQLTQDNNIELKITVLITWDDTTSASDIATHVTALPPRPQPPVKAQVRGAPRNNAIAKDSQWVRERQQLEDTKPADVNEVLLVGEDDAIYEGLSSNFFALKDGTLYTAGEGILLGSVRGAVLQVAEQQGIPVVLQPPSLKDLQLWEGAFISSTSRLLLPLDELSVPNGDTVVVRRVFERTELVNKLDELVYDAVMHDSEPF